MAEVGSSGERDEETRTETKTRRRRGHGCRETHADEMGKSGPRLPAFQQSRAWIYICRVGFHSDTVYATQRVREMGKKGNQSRKECSANDRPRGVVCERSPVFKSKPTNAYIILKRDSGREVERSGEGRGPMARETRGKLKQGATSLG